MRGSVVAMGVMGWSAASKPLVELLEGSLNNMALQV